MAAITPPLSTEAWPAAAGCGLGLSIYLGEGRGTGGGGGIVSLLRRGRIARRHSTDELDRGVPRREDGGDADRQDDSLARDAVDLDLAAVVRMDEIPHEPGCEGGKKQQGCGERPPGSERTHEANDSDYSGISRASRWARRAGRAAERGCPVLGPLWEGRSGNDRFLAAAARSSEGWPSWPACSCGPRRSSSDAHHAGSRRARGWSSVPYKPTGRRRIWYVVRKAQQAAFTAARPGAECQAIDAAARQVIADAACGPGYRYLRVASRQADTRARPLAPGPWLHGGGCRSAGGSLTGGIDRRRL